MLLNSRRYFAKRQTGKRFIFYEISSVCQFVFILFAFIVCLYPRIFLRHATDVALCLEILDSLEEC